MSVATYRCFLHLDELLQRHSSIVWQRNENRLGDQSQVFMNSVLHDVVDLHHHLFQSMQAKEDRVLIAICIFEN